MPVRGLFLVSVHDRGPDGWAYEEFAVPDDLGLRLPTSRILLYHSRDDPEVPFVHLGYYHKRLPAATVRAIDGSEHSSFKPDTCRRHQNLASLKIEVGSYEGWARVDGQRQVETARFCIRMAVGAVQRWGQAAGGRRRICWKQ